MSNVAIPIMSQDLKILAAVAELLTPSVLDGLYHGVIFFSSEDLEKIDKGREVAKKYAQ